MLDFVSGLPHPELEQALLQRVRQNNARDSFSSSLILVPSTFLRNQLVWRLCVEQNQPLLNIHVLTFFQLALRLVNEQGRDMTAHLRSDFGMKECVHRLLRTSHVSIPKLAALGDIPGACAALWATLKDVKDSTLDPDVALDALNQSDLADRTNLESLIRLYKLFLYWTQQYQMYDADDVTGCALRAVASSRFLAAQTDILYYGFYDLTQVQLDLFKHIAQGYPTTLFFPLIPRHPAFRFAQQFFDEHIAGLVTGPLPEASSCESTWPAIRRLFVEEMTATEGSAGSSGPDFQLVEVAGTEDEITFVAKAIRQHIEGGRIAFHDIAVVGRNLNDYTQVLPRIFAEHGIPAVSTMSRSLAEWPLIKLMIQLLDLKNGNFRREQVLDVLTAPAFNVFASGCVVPTLLRDQWDAMTRELGILKGTNDWERLRSKGLVSDESHEVEPRVSPTQASALWRIVSHLFAALETIPPEATLDSFIEHAKSLISCFINPYWEEGDDPRCDEAGLPSRHDRSNGEQESLFTVFIQQLKELQALSSMCGVIPYPEFIAMLNRQLEETMVPLHHPDNSEDGVWVLDAMAARGLTFRAVFVIGMTENVFPRHIREDAFLRDDVRRWMNESLGYKIPEKLAGYDEEKLLFFLLVNSATASLTLLYQRSDQSGHQRVPSSYLEDLQRCLGAVLPTVVPKRLSQKCFTLSYYQPHRLTSREYRIALLLKRHRPRINGKIHFGLMAEILDRGLISLQSQESHRDFLGPYDGIVGSIPSHWDMLQKQGLSPTGLEAYGRCPFQYFAGHVLGLTLLPVSETSPELGSSEIGSLAHEILTECFRSLVDLGYFHEQPQKEIDLPTHVTRVAAPIFKAYARSHAMRFPLLWEIQQEALVDVLCLSVREDLKELGNEWVPVMFEESVTATMPVSLAQGPDSLSITGRMDRVDWASTRRTYRVIDYKYTESSSRQATSSGLLLEVVRGVKLQPPLYLRLLEELKKEHPGKADSRDSAGIHSEGVWFYRISPKPTRTGRVLSRVSFPGDGWNSALSPVLKKVINGFVDGIHRGHFFMTPGSQCGWCDYRLCCHRTHQPSAWRARVDQRLVVPHRRLRQQKPPSDYSPTKQKKYVND